LDLTRVEVPVEAELQRSCLARLQPVDDLAQHDRIEPDLRLLVGERIGVRFQRQRDARRVQRVRLHLPEPIASPTPRDRLQQPADRLQPVSPSPQLEELGPSLLVQLVVIRHPAEVTAQHREHRAAVRYVLTFELGSLGWRQSPAAWQAVGSS
jgi:hypothetical protein